MVLELHYFQFTHFPLLRKVFKSYSVKLKTLKFSGSTDLFDVLTLDDSQYVAHNTFGFQLHFC